MKTRLFPFFIAVVIILVSAFLVGNGRALTAEIIPANHVQPDITVSKTNDADGSGTFGDDETTTMDNPLSAQYQLEITNNRAEVITVTSIVDTHHDLAGSNCASYIDTPLPAGNPVTCTFTGAFSDDNLSETNTATVTVVDGEGIPATVTDTTTVHTIDIQPDITVVKTNDANDDGTYSDDETTTMANPLSAEYQLTVTNNTAEDLTITSVDDSDHNLAGSDCASLIDTQLAAGSSISCTFIGTFSDDRVTEINTATVTVEDNENNSDTGSDTTTVRTIDIQPDITVVKTNDANRDGTFSNEETTTLGSTVTFRVNIANETVESVTIDSIVDDVYGANAALITSSSGLTSCAALIGSSLPGNGSTSCYFDGVITDDNFTEVNNVNVTVSDDDGNDDGKSDDSTVIVQDIKPAITVVKTNDADGNGTYSNVEQLPVGENNVTFRVTIVNDTPEAVTVESIVDNVHGSNAALTTSSGQMSCAALVGKPLSGNETKACYFDGTVSSNVPSETNTITVTASDDDNNSDNDSDTSTVLVPRLAVSKTPDSQVVLIGSDATFTIRVTNNGGVALTNVTVTDEEATNCNRTFSTVAAGANQTYTCTRTAVMADFTNVVTVSGRDTLNGTLVATDTAVVDVIDPKIAISKSPDVQEIPKGGSAQFTITVENTGDVTLTNVSVTDPQATGCNRNNIGSLAAGAKHTYDCSRNNVVEDFLNEATASGHHPLNGTVTAKDTAFVDVNEPNIALFKNPAVQTIRKGGTATFNIAVVNTGQVNLTAVEVVDLFAPNCNRNIGNLAVGVDFTYTCQATNVEDRFVNIATVTGTNPASGSPVSDSGVAVVEILDATLTVQANPASLPAPGGNVKYIVTVINEGSQDMSLTQLNSNRYGVLSNPANGSVQSNDCAFTSPPTIKANGNPYSCTFRAQEEPRPPGNYQLAVTAVFNNGAATATGNTTVTITTPPTFRLYLPVVVNRFVVGEPNNTACQAYPIAVNQIFHFLADDHSDWYRFALPGSGNVVVELRNFVPRSGQLLIYRDSSGCGSLTNSDLIGQNGDFSATKIVNLGQRPVGQYYIRVINDGVLNSNDPYQLQVIFNRP